MFRIRSSSDSLPGRMTEISLSERASELSRTLDSIFSIQFVLGDQPALNETIRHLLEGTPESLMAWKEEFRSGFDARCKLLRALRELGTFPDTIERLVTWILESGSFDMNRLNAISRIAEALQHEPRSIRKTEREWRQLLAGSVRGMGACVRSLQSGWERRGNLGLRLPRRGGVIQRQT